MASHKSPSLSFVRRPAHLSAGRLVFTVPQEIVELLEAGRKYEVTLRPVGTLSLENANKAKA